MGGTVVADVVQLGNSATASQNLVITTNKDGTFTIARGNAGATTQNILTIDANGKVLLPQSSGPAFLAAGSNTSLAANATQTTVTYTSESFDTANCFNPVTGIFQPNVAGYYQINGSVNWGGTTTANGKAVQLIGGSVGTFSETSFSTTDSGPYEYCALSGLIYLNGTTDTVKMQAYLNAGAPLTLVWASLSGFLARPA